MDYGWLCAFFPIHPLVSISTSPSPPHPSTITDTMLPSATVAATASALLYRVGPMTARSSSSLLRCRPRHMTTSTTGGSSTSKPHGPSHQRGELLEEPPRNLKDVQFALKDGVATITLDRPHRLNALSEDMGESVMRLCEYLTAQPVDKVRACIISGGPRAFSTGRDLKDSKLHTTLAQRERYMKLALESVLAVHRLVRRRRRKGWVGGWVGEVYVLLFSSLFPTLSFISPPCCP